jgi:multidrug efflux pump subunit AcrA (membrane-fusion protein)
MPSKTSINLSRLENKLGQPPRADLSPPLHTTLPRRIDPAARPGTIDDRSLRAAESATALLELVVRIGKEADSRSAALMLVNELQAHLGVRRVAVGMRAGVNKPCRFWASSGAVDVKHNTETVRRMESAWDEAVLRGTMTACPASLLPTQSPALAHRNLAEQGQNIVSVPLLCGNGEIVGALTIFTEAGAPPDAAVLRFLEAGRQPLGTALDLMRRNDAGPIRSALRSLARALPWLSKRKLLLAAAATAAVLCVPAPYMISVECELQPVVRRYVAAPHDGQLAKSLVKPGDIVKQGQVLGVMESRELRWELAGLIADEARAKKSRDVNLSGGKTAPAQIDALECERLAARRKLVERRIEHLDVKSPIDGIVVSGDLQRSQGVPVTIGQVLYEIAPLEKMIAELAVPDEEITHVAIGQKASISLAAHPGDTGTGTISRLHPRAVTREKDNVFIAEVALADDSSYGKLPAADNQAGALRPGMKGHARIHSEWHTLAWITFHRPWNYLISWLGW